MPMEGGLAVLSFDTMISFLDFFFFFGFWLDFKR